MTPRCSKGPVCAVEVGACAMFKTTISRERSNGNRSAVLPAAHPARTRIDSIVSLLFSAGLAMSTLQQEAVASPHLRDQIDSAAATLDQAVHELRSLGFASMNRSWLPQDSPRGSEPSAHAVERDRRTQTEPA
jgi:hypothetical protein